MCGIVGYAGYALEEADLRRAVAALHHRGPDGSGVFIDAGKLVGLGHARLAIIDLETGAQPLYSEDRDLVLVCNGEIYEYERLRVELEEGGHVFRTRSDSEVILHLYQEHGLQFVDHLRGEFAFLLYDLRQGSLLAVRDRFGIKPLFFNEQDGRFLFASEAKALFATGRLRPRISVEALRGQLSGVLPNSVFEGVQAVPPGCLLKLEIEAGTHEMRRYWDLDIPAEGDMAEAPGLDESIRMVREGVEEAVRLRLRADVPLGVYLSGGLDSSIVAATAARYHPGRLKVFSIAFPQDDAFNEVAVSKTVAEAIGAEFHSVACDQETLLRDLEEYLWVAELPFLNLHGVGRFLLSRLASQHVKVVLTGEGSDELFLGYLYFQPGQGSMIAQMVNRTKAYKPPTGPDVDRITDAVGFLPLQEHAWALSQRGQRLLTRLFNLRHRHLLRSNHALDRLKERIDRSQTDGLPFVRQVQYFCIKSMLTPYLLSLLGDRAELAHAVEGRTPFLDHHLFEKARQIPDRYKIHDGVEKYVLREAFRDRLPEIVYRRKKQPYFAPPFRVKKGYSAELDRLMDTYLSKEAIEQSGIFTPTAIPLLRRLNALLPSGNRLALALDVFLAFVLTVQILDRLFVQRFDESLQERMPTSGA